MRFLRRHAIAVARASATPANLLVRFTPAMAGTVRVPLFDGGACPTASFAHIRIRLGKVIVGDCCSCDAEIVGHIGDAHVISSHYFLLPMNPAMSSPREASMSSPAARGWEKYKRHRLTLLRARPIEMFVILKCIAIC